MNASVSVIIPAFNAATTITQALESLLTQTYPHWEAIVIDDGSNDKTFEVVTGLSQKDKRIQVYRQANQGVSAARNKGIELAQHEWLLFLDSDDWISPIHLEKMCGVFDEDPNVDAIHCGWCRVTPGGNLDKGTFGPDLINLYPSFAGSCAFAIHACIIRKALVEVVGKFDTALVACEDWDLWLRIARIGARFKRVNEVLSFYRMRFNSLSGNATKLLIDGSHVLTQACNPDIRLQNLQAENINEQFEDSLAKRKLFLLSWAAGLLLGQSKDACHLLPLFNDYDPGLGPDEVAENIFESAILSVCQTSDSWYKLWPDIEELVITFLKALEEKCQVPGLAKRTSLNLEHLIVEHTRIVEPLAIGTTYAIRLEITEAIENLYIPSTKVERLYCIVEMENEELGRLEVPVCNGVVFKHVLKDVIANQFAWQILGRFFQNTIYGLKTNDNLNEPEYLNNDTFENKHDKIGWGHFLKQLWGKYSWKEEQFYDSCFIEGAYAEICKENTSPVQIEISKELKNIRIDGQELVAVFSVGGIALGSIALPAKNHLVTAQELRSAITTVTGFELCKACVREALLGRSLKDSTSLGDRLQQAASNNNNIESCISQKLPAAFEKSINNFKPLLFGRREGVIGTSISRHASLPSTASGALIKMAEIAKEPLFPITSLNSQSYHVVYSPEIFPHLINYPAKVDVKPLLRERTSGYDRQYFEALFSKQRNPWKYHHPYEQKKYELTLSLLPQMHIYNALEIACAEGHFTEQLAPHVDHLLAADISQVALDRTAERCAHLKNISYKRLDLISDSLPGEFNLIVCSEVLYYVEPIETLKEVALKLTKSLVCGGYILMAHANQIIDAPNEPGFDWGLLYGAKVIGETFGQTPFLRLIEEIQTPLYRIQLFQREKKNSFSWFGNSRQKIKLIEQPTPIPPEVEASVRWSGGKALYIKQKPIVTQELPILMYHRIAPVGIKNLNRYRVSPESFEEQLKFLQVNGYYSASWNQWINAITLRRPLPGKAIVITFDDGYMDFYQYAWPLLKKYRFTATVFLVTDCIGGTNIWDKAYGENIPLMSWKEIFQLKDDGVEFGSHTASHKPLTALSPHDIVQQGATSRTKLIEVLNTSITTIAYPYGDTDSVVTHLMGACGYTIGLSCKDRLSTFFDNPLNLPRIEIEGADDLQLFVEKLGYAYESSTTYHPGLLP